MSTALVIQARSTSSRFPNKALARLAGKTVIQRVVERCGETPWYPIVAIPDDPVAEKALMCHLEDLDCGIVCGSGSDVLGRFALAARRHPEVDTVIRVTGDCPLIDESHIMLLHNMFINSGLDYLGQTNCPDGNDCEVFTLEALLKANVEAESHHDREHVTPWIKRHTESLNLTSNLDTLGVKYSVDTPDDLTVCEKLIAKCGEDAPWQAYVEAYRVLFPYKDIA